MSRSPEKRREDYLANRDKELSQQREYYEKNREKCKQYQKEYRNKNKSLVSEKAKEKRLARKLSAIEKLGGKCSKCEIEYSHYVYDFHHINPADKDIEISKVLALSEERFWLEIAKCQLLCANCHRILHSAETSI